MIALAWDVKPGTGGDGKLYDIVGGHSSRRVDMDDGTPHAGIDN